MTQVLPEGDPTRSKSLSGPARAALAAAATYLVGLYMATRGFSAQDTADHAVRDDPGRRASHLILTLAASLSLLAVVAVLSQVRTYKGVAELQQAALAVVSLVLSWLLVHTVYTLRYARRFYQDKSGVQFGGTEAPTYIDFAYLSFTIGMCVQVSDTTFTSTSMRRIALFHALLAYLFGAVILGSAINIMASLGI